MKTLKDAWRSYESARTNLERTQRLGYRHWNDETLIPASIWDDEKFKQLESSDIVRETALALQPLDDLGVLVLFSVFEAAVRDHLEGVVKPLTIGFGHPILQDAAEDVLDGIRQGSFANKVLSPLQKQKHISPELSDKIKQVRDYRNWVAHGKREPRPPEIINLTAKKAFDRLKDFLGILGIAVEAELDETTEFGDIDEKPGSGR
ncbi:hypothetical protein [Fimbriiglobus ruber]|uniref:RiboL-PSP-HEPN domain-containing protein n=1 Tax=Fimbriiglobus ruber TaxID=1908690 RepID=A0A225DJH1_9BACT|nr:hypothetical protein [Fimbriiglobus ruber]OWK36287.1 hypothetical protein FRUB_08850 [Fimbriiglobus ruber]